MQTRRQASYEVHNGLITPPSSPTNLHNGSCFPNPQAFTIKTVGQNPEACLRDSNRSSHASLNPDKGFHHSGKTWKSPRSHGSSENAPPNYDEPTPKHFADPKSLHSSLRLKRQQNSHLSKIDDTHFLRRTTNEKATWPEHRCEVPLVIPAAPSPILETFDGQSPLELPEYDNPHPDEAECHTKERLDVSFPRISCFLADCTLNQRLRPSQRIQTYRTPASQIQDRFVTPRRVGESTKDIFMLGNGVSKLSSRERLCLRTSDSLDPFGPARLRQRFLPQLPNPRTQQILRGGRLPPAIVLGRRQHALSNINLRTASRGTTMSGVVSSWAGNLSGSPIGSANTPVYCSGFLQQSSPRDDTAMYGNRLALAFEVDPTSSVLEARTSATSFCPPILTNAGHYAGHTAPRTVWRDNEWMRQDISSRMGTHPSEVMQAKCSDDRIQIMLEAPELRDDFYCSVLAYSLTIRRLAVALGSKVFLWSEETGAIFPPKELEMSSTRNSYVSSLAFSSVQGAHAILAVGRGDGRIAMYSPLDKEPRYLRMVLPSAASHISFRPTVLRRQSQRHSAYNAENEVFLVGDESGVVSVFFVEWPHSKERFLFGWHGGIVLHARVAVHGQQICGVSWSPDGDYLATGGNDNLCCLFQASKILKAERRSPPTEWQIRSDDNGNTFLDVSSRQYTEVVIGPSDVKHLWRINAAVKAIAFCPWQRGLVAAGGGSNDRCIHFFHTVSGACLARIDCAAQVTSLVWSTTRRQIAATFGFAQPEHPFRIAVYSWPECHQVVAIPWHDEMRALYAIPYPVDPGLSRRTRKGRGRLSHPDADSCIVVAASDGSIKFHEIWCKDRKALGSQYGSLGGSDILEGLHGFDKEALDTIR